MFGKAGTLHRCVMLLAAAIASVLAVGTVALASIPDSGGVIHSCYKKTSENQGTLRVIDTEKGESCLSNEIALSWNQIGPPGPTGPPGPPGITLWASVAADGTLLGGTATAAKRIGLGQGQYDVTFGQDVSNCAPVASAEGDGDIASASPGTIIANTQREVLVQTVNFNAGDINTSFHLIVAC